MFLLNEKHVLAPKELELALKKKELLENKLAQNRLKIDSLFKDKDILKEKEGLFKKEISILKKKKRKLKAVIDLIARNKYINVVSELQKQESELENVKFELKKVFYSIDNLISEEKNLNNNFIKNNEDKKVDLQLQVAALETEIKDLNINSRSQVIHAKEDGSIIKVFNKTLGSVVSPGEDFISLLPKDSKLIAQALVPAREIGSVEEGMEVKVKISTFEFQKYGFLKGEVIGISKDSFQDDNFGWVYEVKIGLEKDFLEKEQKKFFIQSGMDGSAEIIIGERRVINFFIYPLVKNLDSGMSIK